MAGYGLLQEDGGLWQLHGHHLSSVQLALMDSQHRAVLSGCSTWDTGSVTCHQGAGQEAAQGCKHRYAHLCMLIYTSSSVPCCSSKPHWRWVVAKLKLKRAAGVGLCLLVILAQRAA